MLEFTTTMCVSKMEQHLGVVAGSFTAAKDAGEFSGAGYADVFYQVVCTDETASGGIPDQLMVIQATVWQDSNGNKAVDTGELKTSMTTKVAKMALYQEQISN